MTETTSKPPVIMQGGAKEHVLDLVRKYAAPFNIYVGILLVVACTFVKQIPIAFKAHADSTLGRLTLFILTIIVADLYSWTYGLLMALFSVLLISVSPRTVKKFQNLSEGFQGSDTNVQMISQNEKWFVEKVLDENPVAIQDKEVKTQAIQDNTTGSNSTTSSK
jgi:hypothetical protein